MTFYIIGESHTSIYNGKFQVVDLPAVTMNRIARDGVNHTLKYHNKFFEPCKGDIVMFVVGEVDCRCHVWKQIHERNRCEQEVLQDLARRFIEKVSEYQNAYKVTVIIRGIVPPLQYGNHHDATYPIRGNIHDRIRWRLTMNRLLEYMSKNHNNIHFFPSPKWAETKDCTMIHDKSDGIIHISNNYCYEACKDLFDFITGLGR